MGAAGSSSTETDPSGPAFPAASSSGAVAGCPNEPAGFTRVILDDAWDALAGPNRDVLNPDGNLTIVEDSTGPQSPGHVLQYRFPQGMEGGAGPGRVNQYINATDIHLCYQVRANPEWQGHSSSVNKLVYLIGGDFGWDLITVMRGGGDNPGGAPYHLGIFFNSSPDAYLTQPPYPASFRAGQWNTVELLAESSTGRIRAWLNNVPVGDWMVEFPSGADHFSEMIMDPVWGGIGDTKAHDDFIQIDHLRLSAPPQ